MKNDTVAVGLAVARQIDIYVNIKVNNQFVISFVDSLSKFIGIFNPKPFKLSPILSIISTVNGQFVFFSFTQL